jgi:hypothetical protein
MNNMFLNETGGNPTIFKKKKKVRKIALLPLQTDHQEFHHKAKNRGPGDKVIRYQQIQIVTFGRGSPGICMKKHT